MIHLADKYHCTGCAACAQACSHQAIQMIPNTEGFFFPKIDDKICVECGVCSQWCPELHPVSKLDYSIQKSYAFINYEDRKISSSGGAFSLFAKWILDQGGIVFGAAMDEYFAVRHIGISSVDDLNKLRGSKYVQSVIGDSYKQVRECLKNEKKVLFTGTGCQVAGLYAFLKGKRYEGQLITLDLVCHGVPSQAAFSCYLEKLKKIDRSSSGNIDGFRFRKLDSWDYRPAVKFAKSKWHILTLWENAYMNAFFKGIIYRESCYNCSYCNMERIGTCTIADFWGIGKHGVPFSKNVASGVSLVIDNTNLIPKIRSELDKTAYIEERTIEEAVTEQVNLKHPMSRLPERNYAVSLLLDKDVSLKDFARECGLPYKATLKWRLKKAFKDLIYSFRAYNVYKTLIYKIRK